MTAIKEYPFDLSDLENQKKEESAKSTLTHTDEPLPRSRLPSAISSHNSGHPTPDGKRKVSIMADEGSKDRENLPSDRYPIYTIQHFFGFVDVFSTKRRNRTNDNFFISRTRKVGYYLSKKWVGSDSLPRAEKVNCYAILPSWTLIFNLNMRK